MNLLGNWGVCFTEIINMPYEEEITAGIETYLHSTGEGGRAGGGGVDWGG